VNAARGAVRYARKRRHVPQWLCDDLARARDRLLSLLLPMIATAELRQAALLLGFDAAFGYGRAGLLSALPEWEAGNELGGALLLGDERERERAQDALMLERKLYTNPDFLRPAA
jgi:hypothetical protein